MLASPYNMKAVGSPKTLTTMRQTAEGCNVDMNKHPCSSNYGELP